jgi:cytochrome b561
MQRVTPDATAYDPVTIRYHWMTVVLIALLWIGGETFDFFPRGVLRIDAQSVHIVLGIVLAAVMVARIVWRAARGVRLAEADRGMWAVLSRGARWALYLLILAALGFGLYAVSQRSMSFFGLFPLPALANVSRRDFHEIIENHELFANLTVILALLHAGAALVHHYILRDTVLARMIPRLGRQ